MRARNSASLRSFFLRLSALGLIIFETAPTTQSTPRPESLFCRSKPVTPDSYTHCPGVHGTDPLRDGAGVVAEGRGTYPPGHDVEGDGLYRAGVDVEADEGGSIEHGSPFHECGVAATVGLDTHHCRPNPRSFMRQGLSMFLCPAHIVSADSGGTVLAAFLRRVSPTTSRLRTSPMTKRGRP